MGRLEVRPAAGAAELQALLALRRAVFVDEQRVPLDEELDGRDDEALQLVAVATGGPLLGTCRLLRDGPEVKLGRLAVAAGARRGGIALALLDEADRQARAWGAERIVLAAQTYATGLYERAGYRSRGEPFADAGIEHVWMDKPVAGRG